MPEIWSRPLSTPLRLIATALCGPLCVPALAFAVRTVASAGQPEASPSLGWSLLALFGPAVPVYLVVMPLLPWAILGARRGRVWQLGPVLLGMATLSAAVDLALYWSRA